jgi:Cof subfamily protein (haloacid dehalogenase superfamily)
MNYDLLFLDVDGTLKQEPDGISEVNKTAVLRACQAGKKISIASGRNKNLILDTVQELQLNHYGASYTVALNGAHIIDNHTGQTLHTVPINTQLTYLLFLKSYELDLSCQVYTENHVYFNYNDIHFDWFRKNGCDCRLVDMGSPDLGLEEPPLKFFISSQDKEKLECFHKEMHSITKASLNAEYSTANSLEYTSVDASKGLGMEYVCRLFGKSPSHAVAAGDGENDISMLRMAGLGIAMQNALETVKAVADTVTECTCREDGVNEIIHKYLLV